MLSLEAGMIDKFIADTDCSMEIALAWAVNYAKNSLHCCFHNCKL